MIILGFTIVFFIIMSLFVFRRTLLLMHFFQQEEYDNLRFLKFVVKDMRLIDKKLTNTILIVLITWFWHRSDLVSLIVLSGLFLLFALLQKNPCKQGKKPLVITTRVKRIMSIAFILTAGIVGLCYFLGYFKGIYLYLSSILIVQLLPVTLILANLLLFPLEKRIKNRYLKEARQKINELHPTVIGVTGSYGKTSVKHILAHIISTTSPTLFTPGSVNTLMGVTRIIREKLKPEHKFFVVEMGAYQTNSIKKLCNLVNPCYGILSAVGNAHYERFKTLDNVAKAKFELAEAVFGNGNGILIINSDAINEDYINTYTKEYENKVIVVGHKTIGKLPIYLIDNEVQTPEGVEFTLFIPQEEKSYRIQAPIYGIHQVHNIAVSFALAYSVGITPETITAALKCTPQIQHRLEVIINKYSPTIIDNAYNSNPVGFSSALEVLPVLKKTKGRSFLVTPGMTELGALHDEKHFELGQKAAENTDYVLVIVPERIPSFIAGFQQKATPEQNLLTFATFTDAKAWLDTNTTPEDVILYENDLPDLFESKVNI